MNKSKVRISAIQKDILILLWVFLQRGHQKPVPGMQLLAMISESRGKTIADRNFRVSCHTLAKHGLIEKFRADNLSLAWRLTSSGGFRAEKYYNEITSTSEINE